MARSLGSLVVGLGLNSAEFTRGLTKAEVDAQRFAERINASIAKVGAFIGGLGLGAIFLENTKQIISQASALVDLSAVTGSSVESLSKLSNQAQISGASFDTLKTLMGRFAASIGGGGKETERATKALELLGIAARDPAQAIQDIAVKLNQFADGAGKAAFARDAFGKGGEQFLSVLKDIANAQDVAATVTTKQAEEAQKLEQSLRRLSVEATTFRDALLTHVVPALNNAIEQFIVGTRIAGGFFEALRLFGTLNPFDDVAAGLKKVRLELELLEATKAQGGLGERINAALGLGVGPKIADAQKQLEFLKLIQRQQANALISPANDDARDIRSRMKPQLDFKSSTTDKVAKAIADDPTKKILAGQIKALEASIAREREILSARQDYLRDYYQDGRLSLEQYYAQLQEARNANLKSTLAALGQEIALAEAAKAKALKATDREGFQNQADAGRERQITLILQAQHAEEALGRDRSRAAEQYGFQLNELNAKMLELAGNTAAAAAIRFKDQNAVFDRGLEASGNTVAISQRKAIDDAAIAQLKLNDQTRRFQLILGDVGIAQERIALAAQTGAIGEFEALTKTSAAASAQIVKLTQIADAMEVIANRAATLNADGSLNIVKAEQLQRVEELRLGIEKLQAQTDLLAKKFNDIGAGAFSDALTGLVEGTGTIAERLKKAALDFGKSISSSITRAVSDNLAQMAFGKGGPASGFGDIFAKLFGAKEGVAGAAGDAAGAAGTAALAAAQTTLTASTSATSIAQTALSTTTGATTLAMTAVATAAGTAASALAALAISSGTASAGAIVGAAFASGTDFAPGGLALVGERGPEIRHIPRGAQVVPNDILRMALSRSVRSDSRAPQIAGDRNVYVSNHFAAHPQQQAIARVIERQRELPVINVRQYVTPQLSVVRPIAQAYKPQVAEPAAIAELRKVFSATVAQLRQIERSIAPAITPKPQTAALASVAQLSVVSKETVTHLREVERTIAATAFEFGGKGNAVAVAPILDHGGRRQTTAIDGAGRGDSFAGRAGPHQSKVLPPEVHSSVTRIAAEFHNFDLITKKINDAFSGLTPAHSVGAPAVVTAAQTLGGMQEMTGAGFALTGAARELTAAAAAIAASSARVASSIAGAFIAPAFGKLASGTENWRGGMAWVGENEPELVELPRGARVTPMSKMGRSKGGGGNVTNHWNVNVLPGANAQTARQAAKEIQRRVNSQSVRG